MDRRKALQTAVELIEREIKRLALASAHYEQDAVFWKAKRGVYLRRVELCEARARLLAELAHEGKNGNG